MSRRAWLVFIAVASLANAAKFLHLDADFPSGLTTSRAPYTDEGWYSMNAVHAATGRSWYAPGEWNTAINLPIAPLLQTVAFRLFGTDLASARGLVAAASVLLVGAAFVLALLHMPSLWASWLAVLLSLDPLLFGYARLAILDLMMTAIVLLAFVVSASVGAGHLWLAATVGGALLGTAALTKTTALCALPALAYFCCDRATDLRGRRHTAALVLIACGLVVLGYNLVAWVAFPSDYVAFHAIADGEGMASGPTELLRNLALAVVNMVRAEPIVAPLAFASLLVLVRRSEAFRGNLLVRTSIVWLATFFAMLALRAYQPSRYFVVAVVPLYVLFCAGIEHLTDLPAPARVRQTVRALVLGALIGLHVSHVVGYLVSPSYSFVTMAHEVAAIVNHERGEGRNAVLLGDMAPTLSIERRVDAISMGHTTWTLPEQIAQHCPTFFITLESRDGRDVRALSEHYTLEPAGHWNVFGNYHEGRPVRLFVLRARAGEVDRCPS